MKLSMIYLPPRRPVAGPDEATAETQIAVAAYRISLSMKTAMLALALLCIATGLFYGKLNGFAATLLGTAPKVGAGTLYGSSELAKTGISLVLGAALFLFAVSKPGKAAAALVRSRPRSYAGLVLAFVSGLAALGARLVLFP